MSVHCPPRRAPSAARERGQAMLLSVLLLGVGVSAVVYNFVTPARQSIERDSITAAALLQARDALIGRAAADPTMPGSMPCPDWDDGTINPLNSADDGVADLLAGNDCPSYIGRLPWRTLGLPDLRDGSGERLWYALSPNFRDDNSASPLNSGTDGQLAITGTAPSGYVIAIVFAPEAALGAQDRTPGVSSPCSTTGTTIQNRLCAANYLEGENGNGRPPTDTTFVAAAASGTFNDRLLPITRDILWPVVEMRVAREARLALRTYFSAQQYYPLAAPFPGNTAGSGFNPGYLPTDPPTLPCPAMPPSLTVPAWFTTNSWQQFVVYAVAPQCTPKLNITSPVLLDGFPTPACALAPCPSTGVRQCDIVNSVDASASNCGNTAAGGLLTVGSNAAVRAIVMSASYRLPPPPSKPTQARPCGLILDCLEPIGVTNLENIDNNTVYAKPTRSPANNDTLVVVDPSP